ncbi:MAG: DivIVA domain-containing protein [Nitrospirae bacterium]|nr:DivIVA domain-containing protein [Nitrospirota bacterium]
MRITPLDIQQKQFPVKFRGFDVEEVYAFLEVLREEMEELLRENTSLKEQLHIIESQLKEHKNMESTLRETLITAQQMIEAYKSNARKEAELITREAELKADEIIKRAQERVVKIHEDIVDLKGIRRHFKEEIRRLTEKIMREIEFDKEREGEGEEWDENRRQSFGNDSDET